VPILQCYSRHICLVDSDFQLSRQGELFSSGRVSIYEFVGQHALHGLDLSVVRAEDFATSELGLQIIVNVAVLDVVPPAQREAILDAATRNLACGGLFVAIVPRNDASILHRCSPSNVYSDGHIFRHHGVTTFFTNFRNHTALSEGLERRSLSLVADLSTYRQVCLIAEKGTQPVEPICTPPWSSLVPRIPPSQG
jgi:hypothetical protein